MDVFGCEEEKLSVKYLGIPIKAGRLNRWDWSLLLETFERRLERWRGRLLSLGGRIILINVVLSALPTYLMSYFLLPHWIREKID